MPWIFVDFIQVKALNIQELPPQWIITFWTCSRTKVLLFDIQNIHFFFWLVVPTNPGCNCCVGIGDSLDFDPCASPPPRLHLPSPLLPADFTRCEAPWVNQWVLPSATLKTRFCAFLTRSLAIHVCSSSSSSKSGLLPLVLISSRLVDHPSISGTGQVPERLRWLSRPALTSETFFFKYCTETLITAESFIYLFNVNRSLVPVSDHVSLVRSSSWWDLLRLCHGHYLWLPAAQRP